MEDLEKLNVLVLLNAGAPGVSQLKQGVVELVFGQSVCVLRGLVSLLLLWLSRRCILTVIIIIGLLLAALARLRVGLKVFTEHLGQIVNVEARSQDRAHLHERPDVLIFRAELGGAALQLEVATDEVHDGGANAGAVLESVALGHVSVRVHAGIAVFVVGLGREVIPAGLEDVLQGLVSDLLGILVFDVSGRCHILFFLI